MYPEIMVIPMREELTRVGGQELKTAEEVDAALQNNQGTALVVVNSICGCAAGRMRPAVRAAFTRSNRPDRLFTVFAGQDREATERARQYFVGYPPSSPSIALFRGKELVYFMHRHDIETRGPEEIARHLAEVFDRFCGVPSTATQSN
jgi:putative YphP/YqiW family bacilliredoxin